jgi:hypothetical protein
VSELAVSPRAPQKGFVRLSEAAKLCGISRRQAYRVFKPYAKRMAHGGNYFLVPVSVVHKELSSRLVEELPMLPELAEFREEMEAMQDRIEQLCRRVGKLFRQQGIRS